MIVLDATTDNIQVVLGGAITTNQLRCVSSWRELASTATTAGRTVVNTNNTTDVNLVPSPSASTQRIVDFLSVYNSDTVSASVTIKFDSSGTEYVLWSGALTAGESVCYVEGTGWERLDASGVPKTSGGGGGGADGVNIIAAGTRTATTVGTVLFSNSNGLTFGLNAPDGSVLTASHNALTTARASNDAVGLNTAATQVTWTVNSAGISFNAGAYLTTAMLSNAVTLSNVRVSGGTTSNLLSAVTFADSNGVSFGLNAGTMTATVATNYQSAGAYLTTAALSNHSHGNPQLNLTNLSGTTASNSAGLTLSLSAAAPGGGGGAALSAGTQSGSTGTIVFANSNGITFGMSGSTQITASHDGLTTQSEQAFSADASSTFQTLVFQNNNGVSWNNIAGSLQVAHALQYTSNTSNITSNALHTSASRVFNIVAATNNTGGGTASQSGNVSFSNANGISFYTSAGGAVVGSHNALTTAALSNHSHGNPQLNLTNLSGTTASNSAGFTLSLSAGAGGAGDGVNILAAGTRTATTAGTVLFSNANGVSFGLDAASGSVMTASVYGGGATYSYFDPDEGGQRALSALGQGTLYVQHVTMPTVQCNSVIIPIYNSNATNSSGQHTISLWFGIFTKNASTLSLLHSASRSMALTHSGTITTAGAAYLLYSGVRNVSIGLTATITAGDYWCAHWSSSASAVANGSYSNLVWGSQITNRLEGVWGVASNLSMQSGLGNGFRSATITGVPNSIAFSDIWGWPRPAAFYLASGSA